MKTVWWLGVAHFCCYLSWLGLTINVRTFLGLFLPFECITSSLSPYMCITHMQIELLFPLWHTNGASQFCAIFPLVFHSIMLCLMQPLVILFPIFNYGFFFTTSPKMVYPCTYNWRYICLILLHQLWVITNIISSSIHVLPLSLSMDLSLSLSYPKTKHRSSQDNWQVWFFFKQMYNIKAKG